MVYHWYRIEGEPSLLERVNEILDDAGINAESRSRFMGEFRDRILLAQEGKLQPITQVKGPLDEVTNIQVFEIIWNFSYGEDETLNIRAYHVEPNGLRTPGGTRAVVALHIHRKEIDGDDVYQLQSAEIVKASEKYWRGVDSKWGLQN